MVKRKKIFEIKNAKKSFGKTEVLKDISVSVENGDVFSDNWAVRLRENQHCSGAQHYLKKLDGGEMRYTRDLQVTKNDENGNAVYAHKAALKRPVHIFGLVFQNFNLFPSLLCVKEYYGRTFTCTKAG